MSLWRRWAEEVSVLQYLKVPQMLFLVFMSIHSYALIRTSPIESHSPFRSKTGIIKSTPFSELQSNVGTQVGPWPTEANRGYHFCRTSHENHFLPDSCLPIASDSARLSEAFPKASHSEVCLLFLSLYPIHTSTFTLNFS